MTKSLPGLDLDGHRDGVAETGDRKTRQHGGFDQINGRADLIFGDAQIQRIV